MASRFIARSKTLALAFFRPDAAPAPLAGSRALSSLRRYPAAAPSPAVGSPPRPGMVLGYEPTSHLSGTQFLPRWFSTVASNGSPMQKTQVLDELKATEGAFPKVVAFSPLEATIAKPRSSPLTSESSKVSRSEIATQVTFYMIPALLVASKKQHKHISYGCRGIPSDLHVQQGDLSGLCAPRYHQEVGFDILQAAFAGHGKGHHRVLQSVLSSPR